MIFIFESGVKIVKNLPNYEMKSLNFVGSFPKLIHLLISLRTDKKPFTSEFPLQRIMAT